MSTQQTETQFERYEYAIAGHFLSALINGDDSAFSGDDHERFSAFLNREHMGGYSVWEVTSEYPSFQRCDVCRLMADCYSVTRHVPI